MSAEIIDKLKQSSGSEFFKLLEEFIDFKIPTVIKNILSITHHSTAYAFCNFDETSLIEIESFMRDDFDSDMVPVGESKNDYLGYYSEAQDKFKLICGQVKVISNIARECQKLYEATQKAKANQGTK